MNNEPEWFQRLTVEASKVTEHLSDSVMQAMDVSLTVDVRMKRTFSSSMDDPLATTSLIVPMPRAIMDEPPMPVTILSVMGCRVVKSECSGDICMVQALSRRKGEDSKEMSDCQVEVGSGAAVMAARQYFLMPLRFLQECLNSAGFHWIPLDSTGMEPESTGIGLESSGIQWNSSIPAGIALEFRVFSAFIKS